MARRPPIRRAPGKDKLWYPVPDPSRYERGDVVYLMSGPSPGRYRVLARGRGEILVEKLSRWDVLVRTWRGRWRRFWIRFTRR